MKKARYKILERNFTVRGGEIDIIASDSGTLVFVEVKMRKNSDFGTPAEFVTYGKQRKIIYAANCYLEKNGLFSLPCRYTDIWTNPDNNHRDMDSWLRSA